MMWTPLNNETTMKYRLTALLALGLIAYAMTSCATEKITTTLPDGTVIVRETNNPAPGSLDLASDIAADIADAYAAKHHVNPEK